MKNKRTCFVSPLKTSISRKPISFQEERDLITLAQKGDLAALSKLCHVHLSFVIQKASDFMFRYPKTCLEFDDLIIFGLEGLIKGVVNFDLKRNVRLLTYAGYWVKQEIKRNYLKERSVLYIPPCAQKKRLNSGLRACPDAVSLDQPPAGRSANDRSSLHELLFVPNSSKEADQFLEDKDFFTLWDSLSSQILTSREKQIIDSRWFEELNLEEVGQSLGISKERVRQIQNEAISKIRACLWLIVGKPDLARQESVLPGKLGALMKVAAGLDGRRTDWQRIIRRAKEKFLRDVDDE